MREFHLEERPRTFKEVIGQKEACQQLIKLSQGPGGIPHCLLFTGPSGCGKTTLARIVRKKLGCSNYDFYEINAANNRGIDMVRDIQMRAGLSPIAGKTKIWLIDECHQTTPDAQGAFLKLSEEPPPHVYFMLATTNPKKLRKEIWTRCTEITVRELTSEEIFGLVRTIAEKHGSNISSEVGTKLAEIAEGSARKALVLLQQIIGFPDDKTRIEVLRKSNTQQAVIEIARALMAGKPWSVIAELLRNCEEEPERVRHIILSYFSKIAFKGIGAKRAVQIMEEFQYDYFDTKKAGLVMSCYRACNS
jgi:DNA polymerase-3 subunit gamma/tau